MSATHSVLKVFIAYQVVQLLYVHYHTYKLHSIPLPIPINNETIIVTKIDKVHQTRDHLTQEQLILIRESVQESFDVNDLPDFSSHYVNLNKAFTNNLNKINQLSANVKAVIDANPLPDALQKEISDVEDQETIHFTDLASFLTKTSFSGYTDDELGFIDSSVVGGLSSLEHYNVHLDELPKKASTDGTQTCDTFLTRIMTSSRKKRFATEEVFAAFLDSVLSNIADLKTDPLNDEARAAISGIFAVDGQNMFEATQKKVDSLIQDLKDFAEKHVEITDESEESEESLCIDKDEVSDFLEAGISAHNERNSVYDALSNFVDGLDATIMTEESESPDEQVENEASTLKDLLSFPLYSKLIDKIDSAADFIGGYNEAVDRFIDTIGGNEDGGIGKNLGYFLNRLTLKVEVPKEYHELKKKAGVTN